MIARKKRTREHVIADLSVNYFERQALLCGYSVERVRSDYGYDLILFIYDENGEIENGDLRIQIKATDSLPAIKTDGTFPFRLNRSDLILWLNEIMPVVLIVYDARKDIAFWLDIQHYFDQLDSFNLFAASQTVTAYIPQENVLTKEIVRAFADFRTDDCRQSRRLL